MTFAHATPIRRILDEAKAKAFHVGSPGFGVDREHRFADGMPQFVQGPRSA